MTDFSEIAYDRDACVAAVRQYYRFLAAMYLDDDDYAEPPGDDATSERVWPAITADVLVGVRKNAAVVDLLRRLPYLVDRSLGGGTDPLMVAPYTTFVDWNAGARSIAAGFAGGGRDLKTSTEGYELSSVVPPHVVGLAGGAVSGDDADKNFFFVDTDLGMVLWYECPNEVVVFARQNGVGPLLGYDPYDYEEEEGEEDEEEEEIENEKDDDDDDDDDKDLSDDKEAQATWRGDSKAWAVPDFFAMLAECFRRLEFVPVNKRCVMVPASHRYVTPANPAETAVMMPAVQAIYRKHHWPDLARYDKAACQAEIRAYLQAHFPAFVVD